MHGQDRDLTQDRIVLEYPLDVHGNVDERVLRHAFLNSYHQTGLRNLMDEAIVDHAYETNMLPLWQDYRKVDEIPFDFTRRRMSVVVADKAGKTQIITKGAVRKCFHLQLRGIQGDVEPLTSALSEEILATVRRYNEAGLRVIAVAHKTNPMVAGAFSVADESDMVLIGYLAFLDPPKDSAAAAVAAEGVRRRGQGADRGQRRGDAQRVRAGGVAVPFPAARFGCGGDGRRGAARCGGAYGHFRQADSAAESAHCDVPARERRIPWVSWATASATRRR
ncbi:MAG: hypothetical protein ACLSAH_08760 [Bilophila wadsworthia]